MFRFTIRELLLLTVIVALAVGWSRRERLLRAEVEQALRWRTRAGALEYAFKDEGRKVQWRLESSELWLSQTNPSHPIHLSHLTLSADALQPSTP